jgi:hypothetical protein
MKPFLMAGAVVAGLTMAQQAHAVVFTLDLNNPPNAVQIGNGGTITADNITISQSAHIDFTAGGYVETGIFHFAGYQLGGNPVNDLGLGTAYNIYGTFHSTGTLTASAGGTNIYSVDTLTFTMYADPTGNTTFGTTGTTGGDANDFAIASGTYRPFTGTATATPAQKGASFIAQASFTPDPVNGGIFAAPLPFLLDMTANAVANGQTQIVFGPGFADITGGGGSLGFVPPVPEPATLLILGSGLLGLAGVTRRRSRKA